MESKAAPNMMGSELSKPLVSVKKIRPHPCSDVLTLDKMNHFVECGRRRCRREGLLQYTKPPTVLRGRAARKQGLATVDVIAPSKSADPCRLCGTHRRDALVRS